MCAFSAALKGISTIFSIPFFPKITGTPIQISCNPYSPSKNVEHGNIFFWSQAIAWTKALTAAPGAYHAEVPNNLVSVAPPTLVSSTTCSKRSLLKNSVTLILFLVAWLASGTIPVSLCPPTTMPSTSLIGAPKASANLNLKRAESNAPPIPIILFFGRLVDLCAKYVIVSIGLLTTINTVFGECSIKLEDTAFTIPALIPINSSRVIPGLRGIPEVITQILLFAVLL